MRMPGIMLTGWRYCLNKSIRMNLTGTGFHIRFLFIMLLK